MEAQLDDVIFEHRAILLCVGRSAPTETSGYHAVQAAWKLDPLRASKAEIVLAHVQGVIVGVFIPEKWLPATKENFPDRDRDARTDSRWGFIGHEASADIASLYLNKRLPDNMRRRGAANPVRYSY